MKRWITRLLVVGVALLVGVVLAAVTHDATVVGLAVGLVIVGTAVAYRAARLRSQEERDGIVHIWR